MAKTGLGRGLDALIGGRPSPTALPEPEVAATEIALESIDRNPAQPRRVFDRNELDALAASIREHGVLQPIVVNAKLRNVPEEGIYNWDPGAFFGIYKPDGFWFDMSEMRAKSASLGGWPIPPHLGGVAGSTQISVGD